MNSNNYILRHIVHYYIEINRDRNIPLRVYSLRYLHLSHTVYTLITYSRYPDYRSCQMASAVIFFFSKFIIHYTSEHFTFEWNSKWPHTQTPHTYKHQTCTNITHIQTPQLQTSHMNTQNTTINTKWNMLASNSKAGIILSRTFHGFSPKIFLFFFKEK